MICISKLWDGWINDEGSCLWEIFPVVASPYFWFAEGGVAKLVSRNLGRLFIIFEGFFYEVVECAVGVFSVTDFFPEIFFDKFLDYCIYIICFGLKFPGDGFVVIFFNECNKKFFRDGLEFGLYSCFSDDGFELVVGCDSHFWEISLLRFSSFSFLAWA